MVLYWTAQFFATLVQRSNEPQQTLKRLPVPWNTLLYALFDTALWSEPLPWESQYLQFW